MKNLKPSIGPRWMFRHPTSFVNSHKGTSLRRADFMISFQTILLRLGVALLLGAAIGLERELRDHEAGMRTLALVSLGSALFTVVSAFGFLDLLGIPHLTLDPTRIASYIVAGIGFLGAGTIFLSRNVERVKGLTTAATIWVVAAVGLACGAGLLLEAVVTTVMVLIVLVILHLVEQALFHRHLSSDHHLQIETSSITGQFIASVYSIFARHNLTIDKLHVHPGQEFETIGLLCSISNTTKLAQVVSELRALPGVRAIHVDLPETGAGIARSKDTNR